MMMSVGGGDDRDVFLFLSFILLLLLFFFYFFFWRGALKRQGMEEEDREARKVNVLLGTSLETSLERERKRRNVNVSERVGGWAGGGEGREGKERGEGGRVRRERREETSEIEVDRDGKNRCIQGQCYPVLSLSVAPNGTFSSPLGGGGGKGKGKGKGKGRGRGTGGTGGGGVGDLYRAGEQRRGWGGERRG